MKIRHLAGTWVVLAAFAGSAFAQTKSALKVREPGRQTTIQRAAFVDIVEYTPQTDPAPMPPGVSPGAMMMSEPSPSDAHINQYIENGSAATNGNCCATPASHTSCACGAAPVTAAGCGCAAPAPSCGCAPRAAGCGCGPVAACGKGGCGLGGGLGGCGVGGCGLGGCGGAGLHGLANCGSCQPACGHGHGVASLSSVLDTLLSGGRCTGNPVSLRCKPCLPCGPACAPAPCGPTCAAPTCAAPAPACGCEVGAALPGGCDNGCSHGNGNGAIPSNGSPAPLQVIPNQPHVVPPPPPPSARYYNGRLLRGTTQYQPTRAGVRG